MTSYKEGLKCCFCVLKVALKTFCNMYVTSFVVYKNPLLCVNDLDIFRAHTPYFFQTTFASNSPQIHRSVLS